MPAGTTPGTGTGAAGPSARVGDMEFADVVRRRRMVRAYRPDQPVPRALLARLLAQATRAPSAGFAQGWDFIALTEVAERAGFWAVATPVAPAEVPGEEPAGPDPWLRGLMTAPVLVLCLSDRQRYLDRYAEPDKGWTDRDPARWPVPYWDVDTGMAAMVLLLGAVDAGLGACFFGVPPERQAAVLETFGAPPGRRIVGVVSLGHPAPDRRSPSLGRGRRPFAETVHEGRFGLPFRLPG